MTRQIFLRPTNRRQQPLLSNQSPAGSMRFANQSPRGSRRFAEVAGGTTAECAAICCCCPCGIMNFLVLAVYKLPAGLCRKALKNKRIKRLKKKGMLSQRRKCSCGCDETEIQIHPVAVDEWSGGGADNKSETLSAKEVQDLENEMWDRFYSTGFWRSPSQRDVLSSETLVTVNNGNNNCPLIL
ncbi:hypothetical protein BVC80_1289g134 [Macleaya cordata]|uniref:Pollen preferential protein n=1 Tax=Macleaya cordata TaxID=56857 RepID=A0A200Q9R4_MACCD|nr:hypothetical protein BVC80_1289g134 [Macleaya cordata]